MGDKPVITIYFNMTIYRVVILMDVGCELDLAHRYFASLLGFEKILKEVANSVGDKILNITRSVDWVFLHRDLITRLANDVESSVLCSFSIKNLQVSHPFQKESLRLEWHPVNKTQI